MILAFDCLLDRRFLTYNCVNAFLLCFYYLLWRRSFYVPLYDCPSITVLAWPNQPLRVDGVHPSHDDLARSFAVMLMGHFLRSPPPSSSRACRPFGLAGLCLQAPDWPGERGEGFGGSSTCPFSFYLFDIFFLFVFLCLCVRFFASFSLFSYLVLCVGHLGGLYLCGYKNLNFTDTWS